MKPLKDYPDEVWDRFFDFLADDGGEVAPIEQVRQELRAAGIDMAAAHERLRRVIEQARAKCPPPSTPPSTT